MNREKITQKSLENFFCGPLAERAAQGFHDDVCIALEIEGKRIFFTREDGKNKISYKETTRADVIFWLSECAMHQILDIGNGPNASLGLLGVKILEKLLSADPQEKIRFRVQASFFALFTKGYFSVLKAGGPEVASYLAQWGLNFAKIKELLRGARG